MQEKLRDLMKSEGLKPSQLAEMLGINPAAVSHILSGRNKPGFELLQKILRRFPQINADWLLVDRGPMYRTEAEKELAPQEAASLIASDTIAEQAPINESLNPASVSDTTAAVKGFAAATNRHVERIVIFYADHTFESYTPEK